MENPLIDIKNLKILADTTYNTDEGIEFIYKNDLDAYVPNKKHVSENKKRKIKKYAKANFTYNYDKNHYICLKGHILLYMLNH